MADDLDRLAADLTKASIGAGRKAAVILEESGQDLRDDARRFAPGAHGGPARHYPNTITHEMRLDGASVTVEVGPEKRGQGNLGHIFEFGSARSGPQSHLGPALDRAVPRFVKAIEDLGGSIL